VPRSREAGEVSRRATGSYRDEHLCALKLAFEAWQFYQKQLDEIDAQIEQQLGRMKQDRALPPLKPHKRSGGRKPCRSGHSRPGNHWSTNDRESTVAGSRGDAASGRVAIQNRR
jgi:hypothetical protein